MFPVSRSPRGRHRRANQPHQRRPSSATPGGSFHSHPQSMGASGSFIVNGYVDEPPYPASDYGGGLHATSDYGGEPHASSNYGGGHPASDYGGTESTHHLSEAVFSRAPEASYYSGYTPDDNPPSHAFLPNAAQPPGSTALDDDIDLSLAAYESIDTSGLSMNHATDAALDELLFAGDQFSDPGGTPHLGSTSSPFRHPIGTPALLGPSGTDGLLPQSDLPGQFDLSGQLNHSLQLDAPGFPDLSVLHANSQPETTQADSSQGPSISDITVTVAQDVIHNPPWNSQRHVSRSWQDANPYLQPPSSGYFPGPRTLPTWAPAGAAPPLSTAGSSQGSQQDDCPQLIRCEDCGQTLGSRKTYKRHLSSKRHLSTTTAHQEEAERVYVCKCGMTATRKDNFQARHLENCNKLHLPDDVYTCICDYKDAAVDGMKYHFTICPGQNKRGRPSKRGL